MILAIDPGPTHSAYVLYDPRDREVISHGKHTNESLIPMMRGLGSQTRLVVEMIASYGMPVGREVFETCVVIGRLLQSWIGPSDRLYRSTVKLHLCGSVRAKDGNVRQALLDAFGGKEKAVGSKKQPGPLYGVSGDVWAALAVAVTYADRTEQARAA